MKRLAIIALITFVATIAAAAFFSAWRSQAYLNLPLLLEIGLVAAFMFPEALVVALAAGLAMESLSAPPFGLSLLTAVITVYLVYKLYSRIFTDLSLLSFMMLNALGYLIFRATSWSFVSLTRGFDGEPLSAMVASANFLAALVGAVIQAVASAACLVAVKRLRKSFNARFIYAERR